jgi:hypothetical protein
MIISNNNGARYLVDNGLSGANWRAVVRHFHWSDTLYIDGVNTGCTADKLDRSYGSKRDILRRARLCYALQKAISPDDASSCLGIGNEYAYRIVRQVGEILKRISLGRPFESETSLWHVDANKRLVVPKNDATLRRLATLGVVSFVPEGTFFGNSPKEYANYWVEVDNPGCWKLAGLEVAKPLQSAPR